MSTGMFKLRWTFFLAKVRDLESFALTVTSYLWEEGGKSGNKGGKLIFDRSSAKPIFTQKLELPGFQIDQQINLKVDASSPGIQSKIHLKWKF